MKAGYSHKSMRADLEYFSSKGYNLGLKIEKLIASIGGDGNPDPKNDALQIMANYRMDDSAERMYQVHFKGWEKFISSLEEIEVFEIESTSKVLLGTGNASVFEFGFNLSKPHGVPYISAESLKGLVSAYLSKYGGDDWSRIASDVTKSENQLQLFGGTHKNGKTYIGSLNFFDAKLKPSQHNWFVSDIITPHHMEYYGGRKFPSGSENPIPIKITALKKGLRFVVAIQGDERERTFIKQVLIEALRVDGVGGKTAVGFGRFKNVPSHRDIMEGDRLRIKQSSEAGLPELYKEIGRLSIHDGEWIDRLKNMPYSDDLEIAFKRLLPFKYLLNELTTGKLADLQDLSKRRFERKYDRGLINHLERFENPKSNRDAREVFTYVLEHLKPDPEDIDAHWLLKQIAFKWDDMGLKTKSDVEEEIIKLADISWPTADGLISWIKSSADFDNDVKEELLELVDSFRND